MWHNHGPGFDIVPEIYYSTEFYSNYAVERIEGRNASRPLWIHVAYQAMHGGGSRGNVPSQVCHKTQSRCISFVLHHSSFSSMLP